MSMGLRFEPKFSGLDFLHRVFIVEVNPVLSIAGHPLKFFLNFRADYRT